MSKELMRLPREIDEAIRHIKTHHGGNETILAGVLGNANGFSIIKIRDYANKVGFDTILQALVNGYEIEETPEDKLSRQYFLPVGFLNEDDTTVTIYRKGIKFALDTFNIKIEGVNA